MSRRSEGDAMPGWSTVLKVDRAQLGLDPLPATPEVTGPTEDSDESTQHDPAEEPFEENTEPPLSALVDSSTSGAMEDLATDEHTILDGDFRMSEDALAALRSGSRSKSSRESAAESTLLDHPAPIALARTKSSTSVQVEGVKGDRLPAVIVRRSLPAASEDPLLANAPVGKPGLPPPKTLAMGSSAELTQINAAAALGIAPEPAPPPSANAPPALGGVSDKPLPPVIDKLDFGPLKLTDKEDVLARYPVETIGGDLNDRVSGTRALAKLIPIIIMAGVGLAFLATLVMSPFGDLLQLGQRKSLRSQIKTPSTAQPGGAQSPLPPGSIRVVTKPARGAVEIDQYYVGRAPLLLAPPEERPYYEVKVLLAGHKTWTGEVRMNSAGGYTVTRSLDSDSRTDATVTPDGADRFQFLVSLEPLPTP